MTNSYNVNPANRSQTNSITSLDSSTQTSSSNKAGEKSSIRYADSSRPNLVNKAQTFFQQAKQSLVTALKSDIPKLVGDSLTDLIQHTPALKHSAEKLESLFSRFDSSRTKSLTETASIKKDSVDRLLQNPKFSEIKKNAFDESAFVLNKGVASEPEQVRLVKATIESADKFAAVTTYGIKPIDRNGLVTNTIHGILSGVAEKQDDPEFNFVFLYNKSVGIQNKVTGGKRTQVSINPENTKQQQWPEVINAYNKQIVDEYNKAVDSDAISGEKISSAAELGKHSKAELHDLVKSGHISGLPITDLKAKIYMVAADPGLGGSHHNKFCINDSGFAATLGASIGNTSKPSWFDSGAVSLSQKLASSQRDYLINTLLPEGKHIGLLKVTDGKTDIDAAATASKAKEVRNQLSSTLKGIEVKEPFTSKGDHQLNDKLATGLKTSGFLKPDEGLHGHEAKVAWIQNSGSTLEPRDAKPIKETLIHLFKDAKPGDTIQLRNNAFNGTAQNLAAEAIKRGVNVQILAPTKTKVHDAALLFKDIQSLKTKVDALPPNSGAGKLEIHVFNPNQTLRDAHDFDPGGRPVNDHAKVYALKRKDPSESSVLLTGTHNLDGQSFKRSHENVLFVESKDQHLTDSLFGEFWEATPEITKQDIDLLVTEFKKPLTTSQTKWAEQIAHKDELLKKLGL